MSYRCGNAYFETLDAKENWVINGVIDSLKYIGTESKLSFTDNELRKLAIRDLSKLLKFRKKKGKV